MGSHDFEVDIEALVTAAQKSAEIVQMKKDHDIEDYVPSESAIANDILWAAVDSFQERWERGTNAMTEDLEEVSGRLGKIAMNYTDYNTRADEEMQRVKTVMAALSTTSIKDA